MYGFHWQLYANLRKKSLVKLRTLFHTHRCITKFNSSEIITIPVYLGEISPLNSLILPPPPKQCWICYLQEVLRFCTTLKTGTGEWGGGGVGLKSTRNLKWKNENIEVDTHFNKLSQMLLSPLVQLE